MDTWQKIVRERVAADRRNGTPRPDDADDDAPPSDPFAIVGDDVLDAAPQPTDDGPPSEIIPAPVSMRSLIAGCQHMREPIIDGLIRRGEVANINAAPKIGKSWQAIGMAMMVATNQPWLDHHTTQSRVLIIDNELHPETIASRLRRVAEHYGCLADAQDAIDVISLRGRMRDLFGIGLLLERIRTGDYGLVIIDAWYRAIPKGIDENKNADMTQVYNAIDFMAGRLDAAFVLVHHHSKGNQSEKKVTDTGSGAGAQSRAPDAHMTLREHEEDNVFVFEAAVRSFPPVPAKCLRWDFPAFAVKYGLDPTKLRTAASKRKKDAEAETWDASRFADTFARIEPRSKAAILADAKDAGLSERTADRLLKAAIDRDLLFATQRGGANKPMMITKTKPQT